MYLKKLALLLSSASLIGLYADGAAPAEATSYASSVMSAMEGFSIKAGVGYDFNSKPKATCPASTGGSMTANSVHVGNAVPFSLALGYRFDENVRSDLAVDYRSSVKYRLQDNTATSAASKFSSYTVMLNGYYDFSSMYGVTPYVGAGIGMYSNHSKDINWGSVTQTGATVRGLSWALSAGVQYPVTECCGIELGYRLANLGKFGAESSFSSGSRNARINASNVYANELMLSVVVSL